MKNIVNRALVAKKKQFLSKSVPRGTRTIWRYLGALFILFTFAIGNVWGAEETLTWAFSGINTACTDPSGITKSSTSATSTIQSSMAATFSNVKTKSDASSSGYSSKLQATAGTYLGDKSNKQLLADQYVGASFTIPSGYVFKLKSISFPYCAISTGINARLTISDGETDVTPSDGSASSGGTATISYSDATMAKELSGDVTVKIWFWMPGSTRTGKYAGLGDLAITGDLVESTTTPIAVTGITIAPSSATIKVGKTVTLGATITPSNATDKAVTWAVTSGSTYASVDESGVVTGVAAGTAVVTATAHDGSGITQTATITVEECPTSGTIFSMNITASEGTAYSGNNTFPSLIDATYVGGKAYSGSKTTTTRTSTINSNGEYPFNGHSELAIKVVMDCPFEEGDIVTITNASNTQIKLQKVVGTDLHKTANKTFTIPSGSALIGEDVFYIMRDNQSSTLKSITVTRPIYRTITLEYADGVTPDGSIEVIDGEAATKPSDPTWAHHRFDGWYNGSDPYDWSETVGGDLTLTAHWTQLYTITFANGGGTGDAPAAVADKAQGETFSVPANTFTAPTNKEFDIWNDGSADYAPGVTYTVGTANVVLTAQWKALQDKYTVIFKDGDVTLGTKQFDVASNPSDADIEKTKPLYTFAAWQKDAADIALDAAFWASVLKDAEVTLTARYEGKYASSINVEQWVLDNGAGKGATTKTSALLAEMGTKNYLSNIAWVNKTNELDTLDDSKTDGKRNYAYLGLKVKNDASNVRLLLQDGKSLKVKFGNVAATPNIKIGDAAATPMTITEGVYSLDAASGDREITISTTSAGAVVFKQIMVNEDLQTVTLPWRVTYDANGGTCATAEAIWSGAALILPDVTPAEPTDYTFAGWYDEAAGGLLVGAAGASYTPTDNETLFAHFAPVEYAIAYDGNGATSGSMVAGAAGWGTLVTPATNAFEKTGHIFSGWEITKTEDGSATGITFSEGKFEMPKYDVTLVAQWEDNSKVAMIVETSAKYESLAEAIAAATDGQTVQLLQNIHQEDGVLINKSLTLDLNGKTFTVDNGNSYVNRAIKVDAGTGTVLIKDGTVDALSTEDHNGGCYGGLRIETGNVTCTNVTFKNYRIYGMGVKPAGGTLVMNECTVISEIGGGMEVAGGSVVLNNCTFTQTGFDTAHAWISSCLGIGHNANLTVNGGTYTSEHYSLYVFTSGGEIDVENGSFTGDIVNQVTLSSYPDAVGAINISGGSFEGVGEEPIHFTTDNTGKTTIAISGGTFDAPVENQYCAPGYVPAPEVAPGVYTVMPKDGVCLVKIEPTSQTKGTQTGLYADGDELTINLSSGMNLGSSGKYIGVKATENFQEGDVLHLNMSTYQNSQNATAYVYADKDASVFLFDTEEKCDENKDYYITMPAAVNGHKELYIVRTEGNKWNGGPSVMEVTRAMKPMLTAITIDGRDGVIDEANKTVAVQIPYEADLANLTIVPTIVWNEAAASNSIVVNDGSAWIEGANTYKLTDKDNDYTVYTITLTRDVLKHAVKFYDGETLLETLEVEDGTSIAAGDVPADPEKEDYIFQGWAETAGGDVVDVTSFTISAAKNFYAKWAADGAIKLINKTSGAVNEDGYFITGVTATEANSEKAAAWGGTQGTSISGVNALGKIVQYNATTNQTKIKIKVYNTNGSNKYVYIHKVVEGKTSEEAVETLTATSNTVVESEYYEFNDTKNRSFYLTTNSTDVKILQVKVIDDGATPMKQAGEAGYSLNLNKGRVVYYGNSDVTFEGLALNSASNYSVISSSEFQTTKNISFSISSPVLLKVTTNTAKYYVSQNPDEDGTTATAVTAAGTAEFELTETTNPWYLVPSTTSNVKYTNIAFELPKAATPVIETQPATNHTFDPGDMTATVVATVTEGTLHYQWYKKATVGDDEEVGTDAATLTTTTEGTYYVVVTNTLAGHQDVSVTSEEAELGYRVTNDATLMALSYGGTAITLEDGVYNYNVELAKGTTDVPALAATATMDGYATVTISNAAEFVSYAASSTVTVKSEDATVTNVYTVNFTVKHDLPQVDVTATTTWDMTNVSANAINLKDDYNPSKQNVRLLLANIEGVNNNASFNSQALMFEGQHIGRTSNNVKHLAGQYVQFNVTVPGMVSVTFASNGSAQRTIQINGKVCSRTTNDGTYITYNVAVEPGSVEIEDVQGYVRISKIEFKAEYSYHRENLNPNNIGTLCWTNNAVLGGATLYELAGKNEYNKLVFEEVDENRLEAGKPYIFVPENGNTEIKVYNTDSEEALTEPVDPQNGMMGTFVNLSTIDDGENSPLWNKYIISNNHYVYVDYANCRLGAYRAYITSLDDIAPANPEPSQNQNGAPRRRIVMGAQSEQVATGCENLNVSDKPVKMIINGQLFILRGEKMYDAKGQLVK